ncbi:MAG: TonB-dependent receptor [Nitrosomonas sp.]|nr:TonB-dependent receptor [Nitrosomonas sp.]
MTTHNKTISGHRLVRIVFISILSFSQSITLHAEPAQQPAEISIPAQPLGEAITQLALQAGVWIGVDANLVAGKQAPAIQGRYTPDQAIMQLLAGSGLVALENSPGRFTVEAAAKAPHADSDKKTVTLPEIKVSSAIDPNSPYNTSYTRTAATAATKTNAPIMQTPVSIQVVPRAVLDDQKSVTIKDALENISGVRPSTSLTGTAPSFIIRGFSNNNRIYRNGLGVIGGFAGSNIPTDTAHLESIEVLKGPASVLYGRIEPGGLINITTKPALSKPFYALEQQFGSYDHFRTLWDAGGPVNEDKSLLFRFTGGYQNSNSFRDFVFHDRMIFNPTLTWKASDSTTFSINVEGLNQDYRADFGIPVIGNRPAPIPISRSLDDPNTPSSHYWHVLLNTDLTHRLNESWSIRNRFLGYWGDSNSTFVNPADAFGNALRPDNRTLDRNIFSQNADTQGYTTNLDLIGKLDIKQTQHQILVGFDYTLGQSKYGTRGDYINPNPALAIDIFNPYPSYGIPRSLFNDTLATSALTPPDYSFAQTEWWGVYFQDHITLWNRLHILGGGRYDWAQNGRGRGDSFGAAENALNPTIRKDDRFSPRVGVLYQAWDWLSIYGNWTNSLGTNNGLSASGQAQPPQTAEQYEAGLKTSWLNGMLTSTLSFYHITKQNVLTPDLSTSNPFDSIAIGEARSRGVELDVIGKLTEHLNVIANYAWTDTRVSKDNSGLQGNRFSNVPQHSGSLWFKYDLKQFAPLNGLSVGFGAYLVDKRKGDAENTFVLPGYVRLDTFASYFWKIRSSRLIAQLNVRNLLDERYYESTDPFSNVAPRLGVYPGAPLTFLGSLRLAI